MHMKEVENTGNTDEVTVFKQVGPLRLLLAAIVVFCLLMIFAPDGKESAWYVLSKHVAPALVILTVWVLLFDIMMSSVFMSQNQGQERLRHRNILLWDGFLVAALFVFWGPFFLSIFI